MPASARIFRGFTLIELLITVVILGVLARVAAPSFRSLMANAQIRSAAQALHDGLKIARTEAIRLNESVTFTKNTGAGWTVRVDSSNAVVQTRLSEESAATVALTPGSATVVRFNSLGRVIPPASGTTITQMDITVPTAVLPASQAKNLRIRVDGGGAIRLCDPNATAGVGMGC